LRPHWLPNPSGGPEADCRRLELELFPEGNDGLIIAPGPINL
jgi:hypothetical protein